jgi:hypothetical protein
VIDLSQIFCFLNDYLPILLIIATLFTIYFAIKKIGNKVTAQYTFSSPLFSEEYISNVVLSNKKDKTLSVWSINVVFDKHFTLTLEKFNPPIILKAYETVSLSLPKYSSLSVGSDRYKPNYLAKDVNIYIDIGHKLIKCEKNSKKDNLSHFTSVSMSITKFNGHVFDETVAYIIAYYYQGKSYTAFIAESGIISNEWDFSPNHLGNSVNMGTIRSFINQYGFHGLFSNYECFKVDYPKINLAFKKEEKPA